MAVSWLSDLALPVHPVQLNLGGGRGATQAHDEPGETVFEEGDTGDSLYMILAGRVEVLKRFGTETQVVRTLGPDEYFGEMALPAASRWSRRRSMMPCSHCGLNKSFGMP